MIIVNVNETPLKIDKHTNVFQLLEKTNTGIDGIAVAINNKIVSKSDWEIQQFKNNDAILIITATQGG